MTKTAHTPGPWMWDRGPVKGDPLRRVRFQVVARGRTIAQTYYSTGDEQALADTVLMAAAPSLLEALQDIVKRNEIQHWFNVDKARAAIAAATGQEGA